MVLIPTSNAMTIKKMVFSNGATLTNIRISNFGNDPGNAAIGLGPSQSAKLYGDPKETFEISFGEGQPFEGESILPKLALLSRNVTLALDLLEGCLA
ncbi:MAG: hypothetical protein C0520_10430 [Sphingopyxis sp.]|nr:hypothetical protein [Sphingopyxis sp.]